MLTRCITALHETPAAPLEVPPAARNGLAGLALATGLAAGLVLAGGGARAASGELHPAIAKPHYTCESTQAQKAAWQKTDWQKTDWQKTGWKKTDWQVAPLAPAHPARTCCDGQIGCAEYLPSSTALPQPHHWHG